MVAKDVLSIGVWRNLQYRGYVLHVVAKRLYSDFAASCGNRKLVNCGVYTPSIHEKVTISMETPNNLLFWHLQQLFPFVLVRLLWHFFSLKLRSNPITCIRRLRCPKKLAIGAYR